MIVYLIRHNSQPKIRYACATTVSGEHPRHNIIDRRKNMVEIGYFSGAVPTVYDGDNVVNYPSSSLFILMPDKRYDVVIPCGDAGYTTVHSIGAEIGTLSYSVLNTEDAAEIWASMEAETDAIFLPSVLHTEEGEFQMLTALFCEAINHFAAGGISHEYQLMSVWYEIFGIMDGMFRMQIRSQLQIDMPSAMSSAHLYVRKAKQYICTNYKKHLTLSDIAKQLGISTGYLCTLFKQVTGHTVIEYLNLIRVQRIREQIIQGDTRNFPEICTEFGMSDIRYAQRLFKKHFGVSMYRCRQQDNGISLYHRNPWQEDTLDHDIFNEVAEKEVWE